MGNTIKKDQCLVCGGTEFSWGQLAAKQPLLFYHIPRKKFFQKNPKVMARMCNRCGNLLLFSEDAAPK